MRAGSGDGDAAVEDGCDGLMESFAASSETGEGPILSACLKVQTDSSEDLQRESKFQSIFRLAGDAVEL